MDTSQSVLVIDTSDDWTTPHVGAENVRVEDDEIVYEHDVAGLGRSEVRIPLAEIRRWTLVEHHSGTAA